MCQESGPQMWVCHWQKHTDTKGPEAVTCLYLRSCLPTLERQLSFWAWAASVFKYRGDWSGVCKYKGNLFWGLKLQRRLCLSASAILVLLQRYPAHHFRDPSTYLVEKREIYKTKHVCPSWHIYWGGPSKSIKKKQQLELYWLYYWNFSWYQHFFKV